MCAYPILPDNAGTFIGAALALAQATGEVKFQADAALTLTYARAHLTGDIAPDVLNYAGGPDAVGMKLFLFLLSPGQ